MRIEHLTAGRGLPALPFPIHPSLSALLAKWRDVAGAQS
jgi:hypothetical protein